MTEKIWLCYTTPDTFCATRSREQAILKVLQDYVAEVTSGVNEENVYFQPAIIDALISNGHYYDAITDHTYSVYSVPFYDDDCIKE